MSNIPIDFVDFWNKMHNEFNILLYTNLLESYFKLQFWTGESAPMAQWVGAKPQEAKGHGFESHCCHLVQVYGRRYV